jgi:hypothetical protein
VTSACRFREGPDGDPATGSVWHLFHGDVHLLRAQPPSVVRKAAGSAVWRRALHLPFELSAMLRELEHEDDVNAGRRRLSSIPVDERPLRRPYRTHRRAAMRRFFAAVPQAVQHALRGFSTGSFPLFRFLHTTPGALDLMASDDGAALAWCLANAHELRSNPYQPAERDLLRRARRQLRHRRRDALAFVGLPTTTAALSALGKVPRVCLDGAHVDAVKTILSTPELHERARHLPVWNHVVDLLTVPLHRHVHASFLHEVSAEPPARLRWPQTSLELRETLAMLSACGLKPPLFRSRAHLRDVHDDLVRRRTPVGRWWSTAPFPPPPVALSTRERRFVEPLVDSAALLREGRAMRHCLGSVAEQHALAGAGRFFAFALTKPGRSTVAITWSARSARWCLYDLRGPANAVASAAAAAFAQDLLARFERSGPPATTTSTTTTNAVTTRGARPGGGDDDAARPALALPGDAGPGFVFELGPDPYLDLHDLGAGGADDDVVDAGIFDDLPF